MAIKRFSGGSAQSVGSGSIRVRSGNAWALPLSAKVRVGGAWIDSGYVSYPNAATSFSGSGGNGGSLGVNFQWVAPTSGAPVTGYKLYSYSDQACTQNEQSVTLGTGTSTTYSRGSAGSNGNAGTTYYVRLKTLGAGGLESQSWATTSSGGTVIKVVNGSTAYDVVTPGYWGTEVFGAIPAGYPYFGDASSWSGNGYDNSYNPGLAVDNNGYTYWRSQWYSYNYASEWISFTVFAFPTKKVLVTGVTFTGWGNWPEYYTVDVLTFGGWQYLGGPGAFAGVTISQEIAAGGYATFRLWFTQLGYNSVGGGYDYNAQVSEIRFNYKPWVDPVTTNYPATANTVTNV